MLREQPLLQACGGDVGGLAGRGVELLNGVGREAVAQTFEGTPDLAAVCPADEVDGCEGRVGHPCILVPPPHGKAGCPEREQRRQKPRRRRRRQPCPNPRATQDPRSWPL